MCDEEDGKPTFLDSLLETAEVELLQVEHPTIPKPPRRPAVIIHAGAADAEKCCRLKELEMVKLVAISAYKLLQQEAEAADAVKHALIRIEAHHYRQCQKKLDPDEKYEFEADAGILKNNKVAGCIGAARNYKHPIALAEYVMSKTDDVLIVGEEGIKRLVEQVGQIEEDFDDDLSTFFDKDSLMSETTAEKHLQFEGIKNDSTEAGESNKCTDSELENDENRSPYNIQVYGVVACDNIRHFSCGTTVFRHSPKDFGRLSATGTVIGCGISGDENGCTCVSGADKVLFIHQPAREILERITEDPLRISMKTAMEREFGNLGEKTGFTCMGAIGIDAYGNPAYSFTSASFPWAYCINEKMFYGCAPNEFLCDKIPATEELGCYCEESSNL